MVAALAAPLAFRLGKALAYLTAGIVLLLMVGISGVASANPKPLLAPAPLSQIEVTQPFGCTSVAVEPVDRGCSGGHFHSGVDLAAAQGTVVRAVQGGSAQVVRDTGGYGLHVVVTATGGTAFIYAHLSAATTPATVQQGDVIGRVGSTGNSTGPHLHFEVRRAGAAVDPTPWLPADGGPYSQEEQKTWSTR